MYVGFKSKRSDLLVGDRVHMRTVTPADFQLIYEWENNPENWEVSNTQEPFTEEEIRSFVNLQPDIFEQQQMRYIICLNDSESPIGCIDLFDFDAQNKSVGIGVLIADKNNRSKGFAKEALQCIVNYYLNKLKIKLFFCNISKENKPSIRLFESCGFHLIEERELNDNPVNYYELPC